MSEKDVKVFFDDLRVGKGDDPDTYWDVDRLLPQKKPQKPSAAPRTNTDTVAVHVASGEEKRKGEAIPSRLRQRLEQGERSGSESKQAEALRQIAQLMADDALRIASDIVPDIGGDVGTRGEMASADAAKESGGAESEKAPQNSRGISRFDQLWEKDGTVSVYAPGDGKGEGEKLTDRGSARPTPRDPQILAEYTPQNPLIPSVRISTWPSRYTFYENFRMDAEKYYHAVGKPCEFVPFFAYVPQYRLMGGEQKRYYFWWRENLRQGKYLRTEISYLLLYIYEIINLPELIPVHDGERLLLDVWLGYRGEHPRLDRYMVEWYCDYCLIHGLSPSERLDGILGEIVEDATFKEFYVRPGEVGSPYTKALFYVATNYQFRSSRYYTGGKDAREDEALLRARQAYDRHIPAAFAHGVQVLSAPGGYFEAVEQKMVRAKLTRDAYCGSLCAFHVKRRIDMEYLSFARSAELRILVTDMIKYAENQVRAMLGIKARLSVNNLRDCYKQAVAGYFAPWRSAAVRTAKVEEVPAYEKQYEPESRVLSVENAAAIEEDSWLVTDLLTEEEESVDVIAAMGAAGEVGADMSVAAEDDIASEEGANGSEVERDGGTVKRALTALFDGDSGAFVAVAKEARMMPDTLCEAVNDALYDTVGDSVAEAAEGGYRLVEDYRDEVGLYLENN